MTQSSDSSVCGVILAGGQSRRMGWNKAFLEIRGKPLMESLVEQLRSVTPHVMISSNDPNVWANGNVPVIADVFPGQGPLAGLHSAMLASSAELFLVLACDLPRVPTSLLRALIGCASGFDVVLPRTSDGKLHPLCAAYRRSCLPFLEENLCNRLNRMTSFLTEPMIRTRLIEGAEGGFCDADLCNLNTPEDLRGFLG